MKENIEVYKAVRWVHAAMETYEIERLNARIDRIIDAADNGKNIGTLDRRLIKTAVSLRETQKNFEALKRRAALRRS